MRFEQCVGRLTNGYNFAGGENKLKLDLIKQVVYSNVTSNLYKKEEQTIVSQLNIIHFSSVVNVNLLAK